MLWGRVCCSVCGVQSFKVAVLGAAGGIGQPLSLLLKGNEAVTHLSLYDLVNTPGVAADIGHINSKAKVGTTASVRGGKATMRALTNSAMAMDNGRAAHLSRLPVFPL